MIEFTVLEIRLCGAPVTHLFRIFAHDRQEDSNNLTIYGTARRPSGVGGVSRDNECCPFAGETTSEGESADQGDKALRGSVLTVAKHRLKETLYVPTIRNQFM
jgi:hypothetical protein